VTDFERQTATRLASLGVDLVLGHHHHFIRGMERIESTAVFYGLGHLVFDNPRFEAEISAMGGNLSGLTDAEMARRFGEYSIYPRNDSQGFPFHPLARNSVIALVELRPNGVGSCSIAPVRIDENGTPFLPSHGSPGWNEVASELKCCADRGPTGFKIEDIGRQINGLQVIDILMS
jgi:poly-gamma-glutamate synthesis protein (capsule biosynthesis protein)